LIPVPQKEFTTVQSLTAVLPLYKEHHNDQIAEVFHSSEGISPILAAFESKKNKDGAGRNYIQMVQYSTGAVASATFATSQTKSQGTTAGDGPGQTRFEIPAVKMEGLATVSRDAIDAAESGTTEEMFDVLDNAIKLGTEDIRNQLAYHVCERGWGRVGTITAITSTTITIDPSLCNRVQVGESLVGSSSENAATLADTADENKVTAINSDTGVITMAENPDTDWDVGYFVFRAGNRENSATPTRLCVTGLRAWLDHTTASDTLHGVTRTGNEKLTGYRIDATDLTRAQALLKAATKLHKNGSPNADLVYVSDEDFYELTADKDVQKNVEITLGQYEIGFTGLGVHGLNGKMIKILSDANLEAGVAYMGPFNSKKERPFLFYNGQALINIDDKDGQMMVRAASATNYEVRLYFRGNAVLPAPGKYAVIYNLGATS
jgi:hypothetical protein